MGTPGKPGEDRGVATGREPELSCCRPCSPLEQRSALASWRPREVGGRGSPAAFAQSPGRRRGEWTTRGEAGAASRGQRWGRGVGGGQAAPEATGAAQRAGAVAR
uniref:Uncharacterized protein n=1 Tax=Oryza nivara TaxID=4536 RepID=A0A0E0HXT4_ORYNI